MSPATETMISEPSARQFRPEFGNAVAAGLMVAASVGLIIEGWDEGPLRTAVGAAAGVVFIVLSHRALSSREEIVLGRLSGDDALRALMIVGVMTLHARRRVVVPVAALSAGAMMAFQALLRG